MYHKLLSAILNKAVKWEYLDRNPAQHVDAPKARSQKRPIYQENELSEFLSTLSKHGPIRYKLYYLLALTTGLRRGELLALNWTNVDLKQCSATIASSIYRDDLNKVVGVKETKTPGSERVIHFPKRLVKYFKEQKTSIAKQQLVSNCWEKKDLVFPNDNGGALYPSSPGHWLERFLKRHKLKRFTTHSFRHMSVTYALDAGFDLKAISERTGHTQYATTTDIYGHLLKSKDQAIASQMDELLGAVLEIE